MCERKNKNRRQSAIRGVLATVALGSAFAIAGCDGSPSSPSGGWSCDVTLTLVSSTVGSATSPSGSGRGSGSGATRDQALSSAYAEACGQLDLDTATAASCRDGEDFRVEGGSSGNLRLFSAVERSVSCRTT